MAANVGRTPRHPDLKILNGRTDHTDSGGRTVAPAPPFVRLAPDAPAWLGEHARAEWERVVPELQRLGLLKPIDGAALTAYCEMWDVFVRATQEVHATGLVIENHSVKKNGTENTWYTRNPAVEIQRNAQQAVRAWCSEFGLTSAAEAKVSAPAASDGEGDNPFG